jgi:hypothetical protein
MEADWGSWNSIRQAIPFFIEWKSLDLPAIEGKAIVKIVKTEISVDLLRVEEWFGSDLDSALSSDIDVLCLTPTKNEGDRGLLG